MSYIFNSSIHFLWCLLRMFLMYSSSFIYIMPNLVKANSLKSKSYIVSNPTWKLSRQNFEQRLFAPNSILLLHIAQPRMRLLASVQILNKVMYNKFTIISFVRAIWLLIKLLACCHNFEQRLIYDDYIAWWYHRAADFQSIWI